MYYYRVNKEETDSQPAKVLKESYHHENPKLGNRAYICSVPKVGH